MAKLKLDKYFTSKDLAEHCVNKTLEVIGRDNISEFIESSAGQGSFINAIEKLAPTVPYQAYDIEPEDPRIEFQDYLQINLPYSNNSVVIGNPPFGKANSTLKRFYKKSIQIAEHIAWILPISQLNNNNELFDYDLIHSEDLGKREYSGRIIHCCFNIYSRNKNGLNSKPKYKFSDLEIVGWRKCKDIKCDLYICCYGSQTGKLVNVDCDLVNLNGIIIRNESLRHRIVEILVNTDWFSIYPKTNPKNLLQWQIYKVLKDKIPELR